MKLVVIEEVLFEYNLKLKINVVNADEKEKGSWDWTGLDRTRTAKKLRSQGLTRVDTRSKVGGLSNGSGPEGFENLGPSRTRIN